MLNQLLSVKQELNRKDVEVVNLKSKSECLRNELKSEKEFIKRMNKPKEALRYYEELMRSHREDLMTLLD